MTMRYAVIPTRGRPDDLQRCIESIWEQADDIVIVDNNDQPMPRHPGWDERVHVIHNPMQPPNLSSLWNEGMWTVHDLHAQRAGVRLNIFGPEYDVAILNDDAVVPPGWFRAMSKAMRDNDCAAASQTPFDTKDMVIWGPEATPSVMTRLTGWAFLLRGELQLRFDSQFQWWCGDDDMSIRARNRGGLVHVPGYPVENVHANQSTYDLLAEIAAGDMQRFVDKHGMRPW